MLWLEHSVDQSICHLIPSIRFLPLQHCFLLFGIGHPPQRFTGFPFSSVNKVVHMGKQNTRQCGTSQKIPDQLVDAAVRS